MVDLFKVKDTTKCHKFFNLLNNDISYSPAKEFIENSINLFKENKDFFDNGFITGFQQEYFNQRLWELYLFFMLQEEQFNLLDVNKLITNKNQNIPDFFVSKNSKKLIIEATSLGNIGDKKDIEDIQKDPMKLIPKINRCLNKKLKKEYITLGYPTILAFTDFHFEMQIDNKNNLSSRSADISSKVLLNALYGNIEHIKGNLVPTKLNSSKDSFFSRPNAKHIDAILYSRTGTLAKFNRMGKMLDFGSNKVIIHVLKLVNDPNPSASVASGKKYLIENNLEKLKKGDKNAYLERLTEGTELYYNPNIKEPKFIDLFPNSLHNILNNKNEFEGYTRNKNDHVYCCSNYTLVLNNN